MKALNKYETVYILKPDITEDNNLYIANLYKSLIKKNGGINFIIQHRGRRHFHYNINKYYDGIYIQINYEGDGKLVNLLEKSMKFNENIIRYLTIKQNKQYKNSLN